MTDGSASTAPPLRIVVLFHPDSEMGRTCAQSVYERFMVLGGGPGLRIPVRFGPVRADRMPPAAPVLGDDTRTLIVALVDERMARRAEPADREVANAWGDLVTGLVQQLSGTTIHGILPVALDERALGLDKRLAHQSFVRLAKLDDPAVRMHQLQFQVAIAALQLLRDAKAPIAPRATVPIRLFVSHAKIDTPHRDGEVSDGPIRDLLDYLGQNPVDGWFDRKSIPGGARFDEAIAKGVIECDAVVCVLTDHWSDREWCRREALFAKRSGRPLVIVDATSGRIERLFPYVGNAPLLRWNGDAQVVVLAALLEALRLCHAQAVLTRRKRPGDHVFSVHPEALTLRRIPAGATRVIYPDPPLPQEELDELGPVFAMDGGQRAGPIDLTTPLSDLARWDRPPTLDLVGLSLSSATDIEAWGASAAHLATLVDDLATMLLVAGLRLAYGGTITYGDATSTDVNYATRLFGLVRSYSPRAGELGARPIHPIANYVPWPKHLAFGDAELSQYGQEAHLVRGPRPALGVPDTELGADARGAFPLDTPTQRWAYARGLTAMRQQMTSEIDARIALGGKLEGYKGLLPGVLEEIVLACTRKPVRPLYLLGGFGGATRLAIDLLEQRPREEATTAWVTAQVASYAELVAEYQRRGDAITTPEAAAMTLGELGRKGPASALANGLDDAENRELFEATDSHRIVELILTGLGRVAQRHP